MPNTPFFNYQNPFNENYQNSLTLNAYLDIENRLKILEKKVKDLENNINMLQKSKNNQSFEYQTSMNMM